MAGTLVHEVLIEERKTERENEKGGDLECMNGKERRDANSSI